MTPEKEAALDHLSEVKVLVGLTEERVGYLGALISFMHRQGAAKEMVGMGARITAELSHYNEIHEYLQGELAKAKRAYEEHKTPA